MLHLNKTARACRRIWCLFEIWTVLKKTTGTDLADGTGLVILAKELGQDTMMSISASINVNDATATEEADAKDILRQIEG